MSSDIEPTDELASFIEDLHASEINCEIGWLYDGGWYAKIGDPLNGYKAERNLGSLREAAEWLRSTAIDLYPKSHFAEQWRRSWE